MKTYSEMLQFKTIEERFRYLRLKGRVGEETFGCHRLVNQQLYTRDPRWKSFRNKIIIRDNGCDLAIPEFQIYSRIIVHHINPLTMDMFMNNDPLIFDPENVVCVSFNTHQAIHYGDINLLPQLPIERKKNDTCLWRN